MRPRFSYQTLWLVAVITSPLLVTANERLTPLNTKEALPGYFLAGSAKPDPGALGGFGSSDNYPRLIDLSVPNATISFLAQPDVPLAFAGRSGFRVVIANTTGGEVAFDASDGRLSVVREAQDLKGQWHQIEYLPRSWCGNSYHRVTLPSGHYWSFPAPEYTGPLRTKMRFVLSSGDTHLYSNEFEGSINPEQFGTRKPYLPTGLMDPYVE